MVNNLLLYTVARQRPAGKEIGASRTGPASLS
jgi:hypothetical protein